MNQALRLLRTAGWGVGILFAAALIASAQSTARPGTVNYTEGQVTLDGAHLGAKAMGQTEVAPGHVLRTADGKAEMLLVPGAYLRLGPNSAVRMVSPSLTDTRVELLRGEALVEVDQIQRENHLDVIDHGAVTHLLKNGIYDFRADQPMVAVYDGKAFVKQDDHTAYLGKGKELALNQSSKLKVQKFDRKNTDNLYAWSQLRSGYMAEANMSSAQMIFADGYPGWWYGTGWYWNPWFDSWAFVPGDGFFYNPFGFGFYSPAFWYYNAPLYYGPGGVWTRRPVGGVRGGGMAGVIGRPSAPAGRFGGFSGRTVAPSAPMMRGGMGGGGARGFGGRR